MSFLKLILYIASFFILTKFYSEYNIFVNTYDGYKKKYDILYEDKHSSHIRDSIVDTEMYNKQEEIIKAFQSSWDAYKKYAWGSDEILPLSKVGINNWGGTSVSMIDALDTAILMNIQQVKIDAIQYMKSNWTFEKDHYMNVFEMSIRVLGGLISAYDLSYDNIFKQCAIQVADSLSSAFHDGIIFPQVNPSQKRTRTGFTTIASQGSIQLEYGRLAMLTKMEESTHTRFMQITRTWKRFAYHATHPNSLNGGDDSLHEYVLKLYLLGNKTDNNLYDMYNEMVENIVLNIIKHNHEGRLFLGTRTSDFMEHLSCFTPGMLALGVLQNASKNPQRDFEIARSLTQSCYTLYSENKVTGLAPDAFYFDRKSNSISVKNQNFDLRPETIESLFYMWRLTKNQTYRDWGWNIFEAIQKNCFTNFTYHSINNVYSHYNNRKDDQPSFWMAEVLKYMYLLFSNDETLPLDEFVLNTEAHPFRISDFQLYS